MNNVGALQHAHCTKNAQPNKAHPPFQLLHRLPVLCSQSRTFCRLSRPNHNCWKHQLQFLGNQRGQMLDVSGIAFLPPTLDQSGLTHFDANTMFSPHHLLKLRLSVAIACPVLRRLTSKEKVTLLPPFLVTNLFCCILPQQQGHHFSSCCVITYLDKPF